MFSSVTDCVIPPAPDQETTVCAASAPVPCAIVRSENAMPSPVKSILSSPALKSAIPVVPGVRRGVGEPVRARAALEPVVAGVAGQDVARGVAGYQIVAAPAHGVLDHRARRQHHVAPQAADRGGGRVSVRSVGDGQVDHLAGRIAREVDRVRAARIDDRERVPVGVFRQPAERLALRVGDVGVEAPDRVAREGVRKAEPYPP